MKKRIPRRSLIILFLLLSGILMTGFSVFFFTRLDQVVHSDLYRYGLQFNYEWAGQYWIYSRLMLGFLEVAMVTTGVAIAFILLRMRTGEIESTKFVSSLLLVIGIAMTSVSMFLLNKLDYVVHNDLYRYGLQFSYEWTGQYWTYAKSMLGLLGLAIATSSASMALLLIGARAHEIQHFLSARSLLKIDSVKLVSFLLFSVGVVALAFSINYTSSILAFIGLGLVFWGAILLYVRPEKYVKETLLDKTTLPSLASLNQLITELGYKGKGIYLPPKYLKNFDSSKVYISAREDTKLPSPEYIQKVEDKIILKNPEGLLITPQGAELARLFEATIGTNFTKVDLQYIEQNLPKLLIEDLEIARNVEIETKNSQVHVKIENSIYKNMCKEARKLSNVNGSLGCPLCSAIACALAKATGKPVIIEKDQTSENGQTIDIEYRLLEEPKEETEK